MRSPMSTLQRRISVALTAVVLLFITVQGLLAYQSLAQQEDELVDEVIGSEARRLVDRLAAGDTTLLTRDQPIRLAPNLTAWLVPPGDDATRRGVPAELQALPDGAHEDHRRDRPVHSVLTTTPAGRLYLQYDASANEAFVYRFGGDLILTGLVAAALGWLVSVWVAGIVVAPIRRLAEQLAQWSPGSASSGVGRSDEEALLLQAFDQAQHRLEQALAHEREFAANVRHEIRTPLAALRTDAEMLLLTTSLDTGAQLRLQRIIGAVDTVADGVEAAHALSVATPAQPEPLDLADCVERVWASLQHLNAGGRLELRNYLAASEDRPVLDRQALMTIVRNLLRNAIEHAAPGRCEVSRSASGLIFTDSGPGIGPDALPQIFDRYFVGRPDDSPGPAASAETAAQRSGKGLGLAIARQTALQHGWTLRAASTPGAGTIFTLDFGH
ncbi:MAG: ATP-binding protein [Lautropia sp.]